MVSRGLLAIAIFGGLCEMTSGGETLREPLPLEFVTAVQFIATRTPIDVSLTGEWVAFTYRASETLPGSLFSSTGVPFADGSRRPHAELVNTRTGQIINLGTEGSSSWAPIWSPDGRRVAFYSDESGEAGLWIWDKATGQATHFPDVIVHPYFGFEVIRWASDSDHVACQILPEGISIDHANTVIADMRHPNQRHFNAAGPHGASVLVLRSPDAEPSALSNGNEDDAAVVSDLAVLNLTTGSIARIAKRLHSRWFAFSRDDRYLAFSQYKRENGHTVYSIGVHDLLDGSDRVLADALPLHAGNELSWSPDGRHIAYHTSDTPWLPSVESKGRGTISILSLEEVSSTVLSQGIPALERGRYNPPLWSSSGSELYVISGGRLWQINSSSGQAKVSAEAEGLEMIAIISAPDRSTAWSDDSGRTLWVIARERVGLKSELLRIDSTTGTSQRAWGADESLSTTFGLLGGGASKEIFYVSQDQHHLPDLWLFDTKSSRTRQITHLNPGLNRYELANARIFKWRSLSGRELRGALLLPPGFRPDRPPPLVVWVYGGANGSSSVNSFGFWSNDPVFNMQVLATRGYAVLYPDAPLREGTPMSDLVDTVIPAVNAAVDGHYADTGRVAAMGQSYGSYCVLALIAQSHRFKAAVITAAVIHPDLIADYLQMQSDGATPSIEYWERGQGNIGGTPWQYPERYLRNSPIFAFDQIETPVLIGQGSRDGNLTASDSIFVGLRRLGKRVEYRIYENEDHVIERPENVIDFWQRRLEFLDQHLGVQRDRQGRMVFESAHVAPLNEFQGSAGE